MTYNVFSGTLNLTQLQLLNFNWLIQSHRTSRGASYEVLVCWDVQIFLGLKLQNCHHEQVLFVALDKRVMINVGIRTQCLHEEQFLTTQEASSNIILGTSVCLSVCVTITIDNVDVGSSVLLVQYISTGYGSSSYMKVIGSRSR